MIAKQVRTRARCVCAAAIGAAALGLVGEPALGQIPVTATLTAGVHLRAGPSIFYPSVMILGPGAVVQVFGCEQGFNWCDVQFGRDRGWVDAAFLQAQAPSGPVLIATSPMVVGVPVVPFVFNTYWSTWYPTRPWYARRAFYQSYWNRWPHGRPPPMYRPPMRPPMGRPPPPMVRPPVRPPVVRPPPSRPPANVRPPPPGSRPPASRPPPGNAPPRGTPPAPGTGQ
jgi:uncharacterized protein YraI